MAKHCTSLLRKQKRFAEALLEAPEKCFVFGLCGVQKGHVGFKLHDKLKLDDFSCSFQGGFWLDVWLEFFHVPRQDFGVKLPEGHVFVGHQVGDRIKKP